jgi:hypothetical protein
MERSRSIIVRVRLLGTGDECHSPNDVGVVARRPNRTMRKSCLTANLEGNAVT